MMRFNALKSLSGVVGRFARWAAKVTAVADEKRGPVRRDPWTGLTPRHFDGKWPYGTISAPPELHAFGLTQAQIDFNLDAIRWIQKLVEDYIDYLQRQGTTQVAVAAQLGISPVTLTGLRQGTVFPSTRTLTLLRVLLDRTPSREGRQD